MKNIIYITIIIILGCCWLHQCIRPTATQTEVIERTDTLIKKDTITISKPYPIKVKTIDTIYQKVEVIKDSIVKLPITQKVYKDSDYYAVVSGFKPFLDTIKVFPRQVYITKEKTVYKPKKGFKIRPNIGVGYGMIHQKVDVFAGVSLVYQF